MASSSWLVAALICHLAGGGGLGWMATAPSPCSEGCMLNARRGVGMQEVGALRLRGGGKKSALANDANRRRKEDEAELKRLGIDKIKIPPKYKRPPGTFKNKQAEAKNFEEFARLRGRDTPEWKIAELRLRSKDPEPWKKWRGKMWNFTDDKVYGGADGMLAGNDDVDSSEEEEKKKVKKLDSAWEKERRKSMSRDEWLRDTSSMRKINDGKGNIDFKGVEDVPENITDINEKLAWLEENIESYNRYMTAEDLVEHQRETEGEKSYEKTTSILKKFLGNFRNRTHYDDSSEAESSGEGERWNADEFVERTIKTREIGGIPAGENGEEREINGEAIDELLVGFRKVLQLSPRDPDTLSAYGLSLANMADDAEGAQVMYQRALSIDPNHVSGLCNYALLMRDKLGDIDGAREMLERARKADPDDVWFKEVDQDPEWKEHVTVRTPREPGQKVWVKGANKGGASSGHSKRGEGRMEGDGDYEEKEEGEDEDEGEGEKKWKKQIFPRPNKGEKEFENDDDDEGGDDDEEEGEKEERVVRTRGKPLVRPMPYDSGSHFETFQYFKDGVLQTGREKERAENAPIRMRQLPRGMSADEVPDFDMWRDPNERHEEVHEAEEEEEERGAKAAGGMHRVARGGGSW